MQIETHFVIPPVRARSDLLSALKLVRPAQVVRAQLCQVIRLRVIKAYDKECIVDNLKAACVVTVLLKCTSELTPNLPILC